MKKLVQVEEVEGEGLMGLLGKKVVVWCMNYIYSGTLAGVNEHDILIEDGGVVYETGRLDGELKDFQLNPKPFYVRIASIESYYEK